MTPPPPHGRIGGKAEWAPAPSHVFSECGIPSLLLSNVPGAAGLWRVAPMPTYGGQPTNAENGGSALTMLQLTHRRMRLIVSWTLWRMTPKALARVDGGAFPADYATLNSADFLDKTTITNDPWHWKSVFRQAKFQQVLSGRRGCVGRIPVSAIRSVCAQ